ncbi:MAG: zinc ribbon domain-containing protein [Piscirickettsiaceae bacterium]|nr:zinc ribbon domain-containing protein [Piscirickettsiaceae bacterium]
MPLYEYRCDACEHEFEALQKMSDESLLHCPACDEAKLRKLISAVGFRLKGDGWYETDFKGSNKRNIAESSSDASEKKSKVASGSDSH